MAEEIKETVNEEVVEEKNSAELYIDTINKMKSNMVDKTAYNKLAEENRKLANALANGEYTQEKSKEKEVSVDELEDKIKHCKGKSDLELAQNVLKLRSARLAVDPKDDIFVNQESAKASDYANAQALADDLQEIINDSNGDVMVFASRIR